MTDEKGLKLVSGLVKWFDPTKGYGFILNEEGGADILLHANVLRNFGRSSVADQSRVTVWMQPTQRGLQATEVVSIEPPPRCACQRLLRIKPAVVLFGLRPLGAKMGAR